MNIPAGLNSLNGYFEDIPKPITGLKTIQIYLIREILDFTVLRTEEDRELNVLTTPKELGSKEEIQRVVFLGSKQKAVESRTMEKLLRTAAESNDFFIEECYLKDHLCLSCPRCGLYGGTNASSQKKSKSNIKHRIAYSSAFSLKSVDKLREAYTFNGISDSTQTTGQALGERISVRPGNIFPSIVTLVGVTWLEFVLAMKIILSSHKYGAESRIGGDVRNHVVGVASGWEEIMTPLEFTLELASGETCKLFPIQEGITEDTVYFVINKYKNATANPQMVNILDSDSLIKVIETCRNIPLDKTFLEQAYKDVAQFRKAQGE